MPRRTPTPTTDEWASQLDLPDVGLVARIVRLNLLVTSVLDELANAQGITPADHVVLGVLRRSPDRSSAPSRLCELLHRSSGGMSLTLDRLEAVGWIRRAPDPDDRRRIVVSLTDDGLAITTRVNDALHEWEAGLGLEPAELDDTIGLVDGLLELFERATGTAATASTAGAATAAPDRDR
jgi:DNA-binding MarR family transcriptional regulator